MGERTVTLRDLQTGPNRVIDIARIDAEGNFRLEGHDLGPGTSMVSDDGEYEWIYVVAGADIPRLIEFLGGAGSDDLLDLLERDWTGSKAGELGAKLRASGLKFSFSSWP